MVGINHFQGPDFDMQAQSGHILCRVETPQNSRGHLENTVFFNEYLRVLERVVTYFKHIDVD